LEQTGDIELKNNILLLIATVSLVAQNVANVSRPITRMSHSAYAASLGNASTVLPSHSASFFYNPASIVGSRDMINIGVQELSLDRNVYLLSYYKSIKGKVNIAFGFIQAKANKLYEFDSEGIRGDEINHSDNMVYISGGFRIFNRFRFGISVNHMFDSYSSNAIKDYESKTTGIDLGLIYNSRYDTKLGIAVKNLNGVINTNSDKEELFGFIHEEEVPQTISLGLRTGLLNRVVKIGRINVYADYKINESLGNTTHYGLEFKLRSLPLRIGSDDGQLTYGFGFNFRFFSKSIAMNYGYVPSIYSEENSHIFDWSILF
jgi:hypothetical protein